MDHPSDRSRRCPTRRWRSRTRARRPHARTWPGSSGCRSGSRGRPGPTWCRRGRNGRSDRTAPSLKLRAASVSPRSPTAPPSNRRRCRPVSAAARTPARPAARRGGSAGLLPIRRSLRCRPSPRAGPASGTRRRCEPRVRRWWRRLAPWRRGPRRCVASGAATRCRGRSRPPTAPSCRRRRGRVARSPSRGRRLRSRSRAPGRRRGGSCWCRCRARPGWPGRPVQSRREAVLAGLHAAEHACPERVDLLERGAVDVGVAAVGRCARLR